MFCNTRRGGLKLSTRNCCKMLAASLCFFLPDIRSVSHLHAQGYLLLLLPVNSLGICLQSG